MPCKPLLKPRAAPQVHLPEFELPPSLPDDYVVPEPVESVYFPSSCPPAFRLVGYPNAREIVKDDEQIELGRSPLIYDVLVSGNLISFSKGPRPTSSVTTTTTPTTLHSSFNSDSGLHKDDDDVPGLEL